MVRNICSFLNPIKKLLLVLVSLFFFTKPLSAQNIPIPGMSCEGSQFADGTYLPKGKSAIITINGVKYQCVGCGGCTPVGGNVPSSGLRPEQQIPLMFMQGVLQPMFDAMFKPMFAPPSGPSYEEIQKQREEMLRKEAEKRKDVLNTWLSMRSKGKQSDKERNKRLSSLLAVDFEGDKNYEYIGEKPESYVVSDVNSILGSIIQDKASEYLDEKIEDIGKKAVEMLDKKYKKDWGVKIYEKGLPILKIAVTAKTEGIESASAEGIDYLISLIPFPSKLQQGIADIGRKIYTKVAFGALDKVLTETEKAGEVLGFDFDKEEFIRNFENDMSSSQKIIYKWLKGE